MNRTSVRVAAAALCFATLAATAACEGSAAGMPGTTSSSAGGTAPSGGSGPTGGAPTGGSGGATAGGADQGGGGGTAGSAGAGAAPACPSYLSQEEEFAPVQITGADLPPGADAIVWERPADYVYLGAFSGTPGQPASHEGVDYVQDDTAVATVAVNAAAAGTVVYVRLGCPQSSTFGHNNSLRECGAGWGNHVVVDHGSGIVTRYAHLAPDSTLVQAGAIVARGAQLARMGNSGRSETRHLHFELGLAEIPLDPCSPAQSFAAVYDSELLF